MQASFDGTCRLTTGAVAAKGAARIEAADVEPWLMTTGLSFPGMGMGTPVSLTADLDYGSDLLVVGTLDGEIADGPVSGDINAEIKDGMPHLTGNLAIDAFDIEPVAAMVLGDAALQPARAAGRPCRSSRKRHCRSRPISICPSARLPRACSAWSRTRTAGASSARTASGWPT